MDPVLFVCCIFVYMLSINGLFFVVGSLMICYRRMVPTTSHKKTAPKPYTQLNVLLISNWEWLYKNISRKFVIMV